MADRRPSARGKWLFVEDEKFLLKGVTYGTFRPHPTRDDQFPDDDVVRLDLQQMAASGFNTVRTYTPPPDMLLDRAHENGLRVLVGLPWEQHTTFLDRPEAVRAIRKSVRDEVAKHAGHPAILGYTVGNEIPSPIVRWHGKEAIEGFIRSLYDEVKSVDPAALVTYVNYPTTEYLTLPFLDFHAFNVFLEERPKLEAYLARLHNLVGDKPLLLSEVGLDSRRNGLRAQAESISWQVETVFTSGCAGVCLFSWTDEWWRGGFDVEDWDFGLVDRDRNHKPALEVSTAALYDVPVPRSVRRPFVSVVVATKNGASTIEDTLTGLQKLDYPNYEVIVVNDASSDNTREIAERFEGVRVVDCEGAGLSDGRNTGLRHAAGEIIAYIDDDAFPDPDWLNYLAYAYETTDFAAIGGPNVIPENSGAIAQCVFNAPGGPVHVLLSDTVAEHIPGCNMSFRKSALEAIGGFDSRFMAAGDDVDVCWRIQDMGWKIGYHPAALVWHYRRNSLRAYWKQQKGYGKAEALLEQKWPERYNGVGHISWQGSIYGPGLTESLFDRQRIYQGVWGTAPFQGIHTERSNGWASLPLTPEWFLLIAALVTVALLGFVWTPLLWIWAAVAMAVVVPVIQAVRSSAKAVFDVDMSPGRRTALRCVVSAMHLVQPLARLTGRIKHGLTLWRSRGPARIGRSSAGAWEHWSEQWRSVPDWLEQIELSLSEFRVPASRGDVYSDWDLEVRGGVLGSTRALLTVEEHGAGRQLVRVRYEPRYSGFVWLAATVLMVVGLAAVGSAEVLIGAGSLLASLAALIFARVEARRSAGAVEASLLKVGELVSTEAAEMATDHDGMDMGTKDETLVETTIGGDGSPEPVGASRGPSDGPVDPSSHRVPHPDGLRRNPSASGT